MVLSPLTIGAFVSHVTIAEPGASRSLPQGGRLECLVAVALLGACAPGSHTTSSEGGTMYSVTDETHTDSRESDLTLTATSTGGESSFGSTDSGDMGSTLDIDPRFFKTFHSDVAPVGWKNPDDILLGWQNVEIRPDGHALFSLMICSNPGPTDDILWTYDADAVEIRLLPNAGEDIQFDVGRFSSVTLTLDETCDKLFIEYIYAANGNKTSAGYDPGRVCAELYDDHDCEFEIVWCDEGSPPAKCP